MTDANLESIAEALAVYFKKEPHKITLWLFTENLNFGGSSPAQLILSGRIKRVRDFIEYALLENEFSTVKSRPDLCESCGGQKIKAECDECDGYGSVYTYIEELLSDGWERCSHCNGTGKSEEIVCVDCE